ncbi:hypothetical protein BD414DRAFT_485854 [Trametes punicea]|nr:hypothetical protein BD414DRAFT_485854 [Trametes punicea]
MRYILVARLLLARPSDQFVSTCVKTARMMSVRFPLGGGESTPSSPSRAAQSPAHPRSGSVPFGQLGTRVTHAEPPFTTELVMVLSYTR